MTPAPFPVTATRRQPRWLRAWLRASGLLLLAVVLALPTASARSETLLNESDLGNGTPAVPVNPDCNQTWDSTFKISRQQALEVQLARDNQLFKYAVSGAYAAQCVNKLYDYAERLRVAVGSVQSAAQAGDPAKAALTLIAHQILDSVFRQIFASLMSQVCSIEQQVTSAANSVLQNAICVPTLGGINSPLFNFNVSLNLPNLTCDGFSVNPIGYFDVNPTTGVGTLNGSALANAVAGGVYGSANASSSAGIYGTPSYTGSSSYNTDVDDFEPSYRFNDSGDVYGEPDAIDTGWDQLPGGAASVSAGPICASSSMANFLSGLQSLESGNGVGSRCNNYPRVGLSSMSSSSPYTCINSAGYLGKYQMGEGILHDLAVKGVVPAAFGQCTPYPSHDCFDQRYNSTAAVQAFLSSPQMQEAAIQAELNLNWAIMERRDVESYIGKTFNGVTLTKSGLLAAAHLIGANGLMNALAAGKLTADQNGTVWLTYAAKLASC